MLCKWEQSLLNYKCERTTGLALVRGDWWRELLNSLILYGMKANTWLKRSKCTKKQKDVSCASVLNPLALWFVCFFSFMTWCMSVVVLKSEMGWTFNYGKLTTRITLGKYKKIDLHITQIHPLKAAKEDHRSRPMAAELHKWNSRSLEALLSRSLCVRSLMCSF